MSGAPLPQGFSEGNWPLDLTALAPAVDPKAAIRGRPGAPSPTRQWLPEDPEERLGKGKLREQVRGRTVGAQGCSVLVTKRLQSLHRAQNTGPAQ